MKVVAARKTRTISGMTGFQSGETSSIPGACVPRAASEIPLTAGLQIQMVQDADTAQPVEIQLARPTRNPTFRRRARWTRWRCVVHIHPPFLMKFSEDLDDSPVGCPISRTFLTQGPQSTSTPIRKYCQWGALVLLPEDHKA